MNIFEIGSKRNLENHFREIHAGGILHIDDARPSTDDLPFHQVFDLTLHSFNVVKNLDYNGRCDFVDNIEALFPRGDGKLTKTAASILLPSVLKRTPAISRISSRNPIAVRHQVTYGRSIAFNGSYVRQFSNMFSANQPTSTSKPM